MNEKGTGVNWLAIKRSFPALLIDLASRLLIMLCCVTTVDFFNPEVLQAILENPVVYFTVTYLILTLLFTQAPLTFVLFATEEKIRPFSVVLSSADTFLKQTLDQLLGRHQIFKNCSRNTTLLQATYATGNLMTLFLILLSITGVLIINRGAGITTNQVIAYFNSELSPKALFLIPGSLLSLIIAVYWRLQSDYKDRWKYCADKVYDYMALEIKLLEKDTPSDDSKNHLHDMRIAVGCDILQLDLWAKRGFAHFFYEILHLCAKNKDDTEAVKIIESSREQPKILSDSEAEKILHADFKT